MAYLNEKKAVGSVVVHKMSVGGSSNGHIAYEVYEPSSYIGPHGTLFTIDDKVHGSVRTRRLPQEIDAIPVKVNGQWNQARFDAIDAWRAGVYNECYGAILAAFPEAAQGTQHEGQIDIYGT